MWGCKTATVDELVFAINKSHELGMGVLLKPHIDLTEDPAYWRGLIGTGFNDGEWKAWFESYTKFILFYANIAEENNVEMFVNILYADI